MLESCFYQSSNFTHVHMAPCKGILDSGFHAMDSGFQVLDSGFFVSGTWILDPNR